MFTSGSDKDRRKKLFSLSLLLLVYPHVVNITPIFDHVLFTPANEVWGKVIFSQASVILFTGGAPCVAGRACQRGVRGREGVRGRRNGHCSGRYASYWNAFLLPKVL